MAINPYIKIRKERIKHMPDLTNQSGNYLMCENGEIKAVSANSLVSYFDSTNVVKGFKIVSVDDELIRITGGSVISPEVNGKKYILEFPDQVLDTNHKIESESLNTIQMNNKLIDDINGQSIGGIITDLVYMSDKLDVINGEIIGDGESTNEIIYGNADKINTRVFEQPRLTSNNSSDLMTVSCQDYHSGEVEYDAWRAFTGTNTDYHDCWHSNTGVLPKWLQVDLKYPIAIEKFAIQNRNQDAQPEYIQCMTVFKIEGLNENDEWIELVNVDGINQEVQNQSSNAWNEYVSNNNEDLFKSVKITIFNSSSNEAVAIGRFEIIGKHQGYNVPSTKYNIFVIGRENEENPDAKIITTTHDYPVLPDGYTYAVKLGMYRTNKDYKIDSYYPKEDLIDSYNHGFILMESLGTSGYRVYSDGWKEQWGNNANPVFPIAFEEIPVIVERGATNVTRTGMTIGLQKWKVEGY